jgi:hypothetical protein
MGEPAIISEETVRKIATRQLALMDIGLIPNYLSRSTIVFSLGPGSLLTESWVIGHCRKSSFNCPSS